jgi:hypothetical protein
MFARAAETQVVRRNSGRAAGNGDDTERHATARGHSVTGPLLQIRLPLWTRMLFGAFAGLVPGAFIITRAGEISLGVILTLFVAGPLFGAVFVYGLDRYRLLPGGPRARFPVAGALAGAAVASLGYEVGNLSAPWVVLVGGASGAVIGSWLRWEFAPHFPNSGGWPLRISASPSMLSRLLPLRIVDEVIDHGDHLVFRKGDVEVSIPLRDIMSIDESARYPFAGRIKVQLGFKTPLGGELFFLPRHFFTRFQGSPLVEDLNERIFASKSLANPSADSLS